MSLIRPNATVTIDGRTLSAAAAGLAWIEVDLAVTGAHDAAQFEVGRASKFASASPGASVTIALGDKDGETDVLTGELGVPLKAPEGCIVEAYSATIALSRSYKSQAYVGQSISDVVNDLASAVDIDKVDANIALSVYYADNRRSVWTHLQTLAQLARADLGASASGALRFVPAGGGFSPTRLHYGAELLDWTLGAVAQPDAVAVVAHGAGSEAGPNKWHWVRHDPVGAGGAPSRIVGGIASRDAAELAARAAADRAKRAARRGTVVIAGDASIRAGDVVELSGVPDTDLGPLHVLRVRHRLDARGFITRLSVEAAGGGLSL